MCRTFFMNSLVNKEYFFHDRFCAYKLWLINASFSVCLTLIHGFGDLNVRFRNWTLLCLVIKIFCWLFCFNQYKSWFTFNHIIVELSDISRNWTLLCLVNQYKSWFTFNHIIIVLSDSFRNSLRSSIQQPFSLLVVSGTLLNDHKMYPRWIFYL